MKNPKPVSEKTMQKANKFLEEYNLKAEQLSESQKDCLFGYVKEERVAKCYVFIFIVCIIFFIIASLYYVPLIKFKVESLAINAAKVTPKAREYVKNYSLKYIVMGFVWGSITYALLLGGAVETVLSIRRLREKRRIFEAFLPAVQGREDGSS